MAEAAAEVERILDALLPRAEGPEGRLFEAMRYAALAPGKRLRPILVLVSAGLWDVEQSSALRVAAAVEATHAFSLIHDDLPCMDDDSIRRGQPTTHVKFDEATAVLAGDALLSLAFEVLAHEKTHGDARVRAALVAALAIATGGHGLAGGQSVDLALEHVAADIGAITRLQQMKTGALIAFACESGAILARAGAQDRQALRAYAHDLGLAFQIVDDLLDAEGTTRQLGKRARKDAAAGKATFVSLMGIDRARTQADMLARQATEHLATLPGGAEPLRRIAQFVVERQA